MGEIAVEATFASRSDGWQEPIRDTQTFGGMTLTAAADFARSFVVLLGGDSTPVYGHLVVARSVFDACVAAAWLNHQARDRRYESAIGPGRHRRSSCGRQRSSDRQAQWSYLSSVSHVTWYGLRQAITSPAPTPGLAGGLVSYGTTSSSVRAQALCVLIALRKAADARFVLMGWADEDWRAACERAQAHELALMRAYQQGNA
jgi:hypothetical protein